MTPNVKLKLDGNIGHIFIMYSLLDNWLLIHSLFKLGKLNELYVIFIRTIVCKVWMCIYNDKNYLSWVNEGIALLVWCGRGGFVHHSIYFLRPILLASTFQTVLCLVSASSSTCWCFHIQCLNIQSIWMRTHDNYIKLGRKVHELNVNMRNRWTLQNVDASRVVSFICAE